MSCQSDDFKISVTIAVRLHSQLGKARCLQVMEGCTGTVLDSMWITFAQRYITMGFPTCSTVSPICTRWPLAGRGPDLSQSADQWITVNGLPAVLVHRMNLI